MCVPPALQNWFSSVRDGLFCSAVSIPQRAANSNTKLSQVRLFIRKNTLFSRKKGTFFSQMYHTTQTVRKAPTTGFFIPPRSVVRCEGGNGVWAEETPHQASERAVLASRRGAVTTPYFLYGEERQRRMGGRDAVQTPVRSKGGVYSSLAAVRSWVKPSVMPQLCI